MTFLQSLRAGLALSTDQLAASAETYLPPPELASPWAPVEDNLLPVVVNSLYAPDSDLLPLTREYAMSVPAVARARDLCCATLGRLRLVAVDEATGVELDRTHQSSQLVRQPDPAQPRFVQITWTVDDLIFYGYSHQLVIGRYAPARPGTLGRVAQLRRLLPGALQLRNGRPWVTGRGFVDPADVIRIDGPHEGLLNRGGPTVRAARDLERSAARFARNPVPAVDLHQTGGPQMGKTDRAALVKEWADARAGENGGVAYTSEYIQARVLGAPAEHLLIEGRNTQAIDIARHVGVTADAIDASPERASMTYSNTEGKNRNLIDYGLAAYGAAIEARLSMADVTPTGVRVEFSYGQLTDVADTDPTTPAPGAPAPAPTPESRPTA